MMTTTIYTVPTTIPNDSGIFSVTSLAALLMSLPHRPFLRQKLFDYWNESYRNEVTKKRKEGEYCYLKLANFSRFFEVEGAGNAGY